MSKENKTRVINIEKCLSLYVDIDELYDYRDGCFKTISDIKDKFIFNKLQYDLLKREFTCFRFMLKSIKSLNISNLRNDMKYGFVTALTINNFSLFDLVEKVFIDVIDGVIELNEKELYRLSNEFKIFVENYRILKKQYFIKIHKKLIFRKCF